VYGPRTGTEPPVTRERHTVLDGFEETDLLPFAGRIEVVNVEGSAETPLTFVPPFPIFPPETSWMRYPNSDVPALILNTAAGGKVAYLAADVDRCFGRDGQPDHADLLANLVRWTAGEEIPLSVEGSGVVDCHLYEQPGRLVLHLVNLTSSGVWSMPLQESVPVGSLKVRLRVPEDLGGSVRFLVARREAEPSVRDGWLDFEIPSIRDHEVIVVG
jgi:hypothetical protein